MENNDENSVPAGTESENPSGFWNVSTRHQNRMAAVQFLYWWAISHDAGTPVNRDELGAELAKFFEPPSVPVEPVDEFGVPADPWANFSLAAEVAAMSNCFVPADGRPRNFYAFAEQLVAGTLESLDLIDERIKSLTQKWNFERIDRVALAILRMSLYELLMRFDIPPIVAVNESINLVKELSDVDTKRFVNGILDTVCKTLSRPLR